MKNIIAIFTIIVLLSSSCKKEVNRAEAFEGIYTAPSPYANYNRVKVSRVTKNSVSFVFLAKDSSQYLLIPTAIFISDTSLTFDLQTNIAGSIEKYTTKGSAIIYADRLLITGDAVNATNEFDFFKIPFEGYR